jgi:hypothetical protein
MLSVPELLTAAHDGSEFSCGKPSLDHWLKTRALANQKKGFTAVLVAHEQGRVPGRDTEAGNFWFYMTGNHPKNSASPSAV